MDPSTTQMMNIWCKWASSKDPSSTLVPYLGSDDKQERVLAKWYRPIQDRHRKNVLDHEIAVACEGLPGWSWGTSRDAAFGKKAQAWGTFYRLNGRAPRKSAASKEESGLAAWASRVLKAAAENRLTESQTAALYVTEGWTFDSKRKCRGPPLSFTKRLDAWKAFVNQHQRLPGKGETNEKLFEWQQIMVKDYHNGALKKERYNLLSQLPGWSWTQQPDILTQARKWTAWVRFNGGEFPNPQSTTKKERELGMWAVRTKQQLHAGLLPPEISTQMQNPQWKRFADNVMSPAQIMSYKQEKAGMNF